jgi:hypothetical protein
MFTAQTNETLQNWIGIFEGRLKVMKTAAAQK